VCDGGQAIVVTGPVVLRTRSISSAPPSPSRDQSLVVLCAVQPVAGRVRSHSRKGAWSTNNVVATHDMTTHATPLVQRSLPPPHARRPILANRNTPSSSNRYYYDAPSSGSSDTWIIFLQGGGGCTFYSAEPQFEPSLSDCHARSLTPFGSSNAWPTTFDMMSNVWPSTSATSPGILDADSTVNPDFHDAHHVFVRRPASPCCVLCRMFVLLPPREYVLRSSDGARDACFDTFACYHDAGAVELNEHPSGMQLPAQSTSSSTAATGAFEHPPPRLECVPIVSQTL
jgi:hypothetical protein